jgi:hypothetical protein
MFKTLHLYKPATLFTLLWIASISLVSFTATAADLARYDYKKAVNGQLLIYKYSGVNAADRVRVGELWLAEVFSEKLWRYAQSILRNVSQIHEKIGIETDVNSDGTSETLGILAA